VDRNCITTMEQRISRLEYELAEAARRPRRTGPLAWLIGCGILAVLTGALSLGAASAATPPQRLTVKAPFQVVDDKGNVVMLVDEHGISLESGGHPVIQLTKNNWGGSLRSFDPAGTGNGCLCAMQDGSSQLQVGLPGSGNITLGGAANGNVGLRVYNGQEQRAFYGSVPTGGEVALYAAGAANAQTFLGASHAGGVLELLREDGGLVALLAEHDSGGYFGLMNNAGIARVEAGVLNSQDDGVVRAFGPGGFNFILGRE
jgi:hypothetical protein